MVRPRCSMWQMGLKSSSPVNHSSSGSAAAAVAPLAAPSPPPRAPDVPILVARCKKPPKRRRMDCEADAVKDRERGLPAVSDLRCDEAFLCWLADMQHGQMKVQFNSLAAASAYRAVALGPLASGSNGGFPVERRKLLLYGCCCCCCAGNNPAPRLCRPLEAVSSTAVGGPCDELEGPPTGSSSCSARRSWLLFHLWHVTARTRRKRSLLGRRAARAL
jgi:hypothetical protein